MSSLIGSCVRKRKYSEGLADKIILKRYESDGTKLRKYRCNICRRWHLTSEFRGGQKFYNPKVSEGYRRKCSLSDSVKKRIKADDREGFCETLVRHLERLEIDDTTYVYQETRFRIYKRQAQVKGKSYKITVAREVNDEESIC